VNVALTAARNWDVPDDPQQTTQRFDIPPGPLGDVLAAFEAASEFVEVQGNAAPLSLRTFTEPVRDIPQTIEVIPSEVFQAQGVTSLRDVLRNVPGITFQAGEHNLLRRWAEL
jgi:outer membrane receptor protein involved in Fe transport